VQKAIQQSHPDMIVLGTHGRTGVQKVLLGSVAEEIFRRSPVPVLTIGPAVSRGTHSDGRFRAVLFATDFGPESDDAAHYAMSLAEENQARLILLHVINSSKQNCGNSSILSAAEVMHQLHEIVPAEAELWCRPEPVVEYGDPAKMVLHAAKNRGADLIVLGVHGSTEWQGPVAPLERAIAHKVVAHSPCPVLTARS
jgi:nucleotide-binding universal stress UspA family protein